MPPKGLIWIALASLLLGSGCFGIDFEVNVVWLPDSGSFLFTRDGELVQFDVGTRGERTVLRLDWLEAGEGRVAVSPDGKRVALVKVDSNKDRVEFTIHVFDLKGKRLAQSPVVRVARQVKPSEPNEVKPSVDCGFAEWTSDGKRIVFFAGFDRQSGLGIFDLGDHAIRRLPKLSPAPVVLINGRCTLADGSGVVAMQNTGDEISTAKLVLVDWDEWVFEITGQDRLNSKSAEKYSVLPQARWENEKLVITNQSDAFPVAIDTVKREMTRMPESRDRAALVEHAKAGELSNVVRLGEEFVLQTEKGAIQLARPRARAVKTLVSDASGVFFVFAPGERHVVIRYQKENRTKLLILNAQGKVVSERQR